MPLPLLVGNPLAILTHSCSNNFDALYQVFGGESAAGLHLLTFAAEHRDLQPDLLGALHKAGCWRSPPILATRVAFTYLVLVLLNQGTRTQHVAEPHFCRGFISTPLPVGAPTDLIDDQLLYILATRVVTSIVTCSRALGSYIMFFT